MEYRNSEGYPDSIAYHAMKSVEKDEQIIQAKLNKLILCLKLIVELAGFDLTARIQVKHRKSGREFK
ncbi:hypothetical protein FACS1894217_04960 [Clostridia bacterium]|nr:hypothetical protein FACS1894217_04960 [Clostridia bacterium]